MIEFVEIRRRKYSGFVALLIVELLKTLFQPGQLLIVFCNFAEDFKARKMKTMHKITGCLLLAAVLGFCNCGPKLPELPVEEVKPYFADAAKTKAIDTAFYEVKDAKGNKLGTVLYSSPYSDEVKGFNGPTPLLIALNAEGRIKNIVLLENQETPKFAKHVEDGGLYEAWNGLTAEEALGKEVDAISGATYTSNGVKNSLKARLEAYQRQLKK